MGITPSALSGLRLSYYSADNGDDDVNWRGAESSARLVPRTGIEV